MKLLKKGHEAASTLHQGASSVVFTILSCTTHPAEGEDPIIFCHHCVNPV